MNAQPSVTKTSSKQVVLSLFSPVSFSSLCLVLFLSCSSLSLSSLPLSFCCCLRLVDRVFRCRFGKHSIVQKSSLQKNWPGIGWKNNGGAQDDIRHSIFEGILHLQINSIK